MVTPMRLLLWTNQGRYQRSSDSIRSELLPGVERRIYVKVDAHAKYADVETALDAIRYAGISNITIMVEPRRDLSP